MSEKTSENPTIFISYSWSNTEHEQWVLNLATELVESGVDVTLDKWDLKEGHDAIAFMEKMVTDPEIMKVLIVADRVYSEKADGRAGGVGTETQIISQEVYERREQDKFAAVVTELDLDGKPCLPTFFKSRIYIDFTDPSQYATKFEQLLRWVYGKPINVKPSLGKKPAYLEDSNSVTLPTSVAYRQAISAIKEGRSNASYMLEIYLDTFTESLENFRIPVDYKKDEYDDLLLKNIEDFIPNRNELLQTFIAATKFGDEEELLSLLRRFYERLIPYMFRPTEITHYREWDWDNYKFIVHEIFLYHVLILLRYEKYSFLNQLLESTYYVGSSSISSHGLRVVDYTIFRWFCESLRYRNERLQLRRISLRADLLEKRSHSSGFDFNSLMQADFILYLRSCSVQTTRGWFPDSLVYVERMYGAMEVFARSQSTSFFEKIKAIIGVENREGLGNLLEKLRSGKIRTPSWDYNRVDPDVLIDFENIGTKK